jgi:hypothetical protein
MPPFLITYKAPFIKYSVSLNWSVQCRVKIRQRIPLYQIWFPAEIHTLSCSALRRLISPLAHIPAFCRNRIRLRSWSFSHVPALLLPVASTDHVYVASLILNAAQVRRARRANSNAVTLKLISRPPACLPARPPARQPASQPARRPTCQFKVPHPTFQERQLGGACVDRLRVNTPIYLHCIQRRSRTLLRFCRFVCKRP